MRRIVEKTEKIAMEYLTGLGFDRDQVVPLIEQAKKDMVAELIRLDKLRKAEPVDPVALDRSLHALKGLLFNLGNHDLAEKLEAIRHEGDPATMVADLDRVLREAVRADQ
jgi:hypothetical protein